MTWFKVDDGFWSHPKVLTLSDAAVALWVKSGSYCGKHLTDGYVSDEIISYLSRNDNAPLELITAGLWHRVADGYQFHDWNTYQDTRADVEKRRAAWKKRQAKSRANNDEKNDTSYIYPFHSKGTRDSHSDTTRESRRDITEPATPMPQELKQWIRK